MRRIILSVSLVTLGASAVFAHLSTDPCVRDLPGTRSWWMDRFLEKRALAAKGGYPVVFIGDSITHYWETKGKETWEKNFETGECRALNVGFSADCTEHVLWRLQHGQLDGTDPKAIVLMIGTNNRTDPPEDVAAGYRIMLDALMPVLERFIPAL